MPAYVIVQETVRDEATFARYRAQVLPTLEAYGAKFLVRGGTFEVLEGALDAERLVVLEFPGIAQVKAWYNSKAYQRLYCWAAALRARILPVASAGLVSRKAGKAIVEEVVGER